ncbi:MAG: alpha/beta fold hydrolase [Candidatus Thermoplasmatota archaeon]
MQRRTRILAIVAAVLLAVGAVSGAVVFRQVDGIARDNLANRTFVRGHQQLPSEFGIPYENVTVPSGDLALAGWWMPATSPAPDALTVVLVHGLGSNMSKVVRMWAPHLHGLGYNLLSIDLRNHGASPDTDPPYVTYGNDEADDVAAAVAYVRAHAGETGIDPERIVLYGGSMGGATVLNAAARSLPGVIGVLSDSSFASLSFQAHLDGDEQGYPGFVVGWVLDRMDALAPSPPTKSRPDLAVQGLAISLLLAHCDDDTRIEAASFERLKHLAPTGTTTWNEPCPRGPSTDHHLDGWMAASYNATVAGFLAGL